MNYKIVIKTLGLVLIFLGLTMLTPLPFSLYYGGSDFWGIAISAGITILVGALAYWFTPKNLDKRRADIRPKEGFAITGLSWILMAAFGSLPFMLTGSIPSFTDAYFETMSGFTTTGASILTNIEIIPHGVLFWRSFTHWLGGMGIIVLSIAILPYLGIGGMQLFKAEVPGPTADKLTPRVTETAKILYGVYLLMTIVQTILLMFGGMNLFDSLCHTFGTMGTGGFSTKNASVGFYNSAYIDYVIILFMILAGMNFSLHYRIIRGDWRSFFKNEESKIYLLIIAIAAGLIVKDIYLTNYSDIQSSVQYSLFQVVSIMTTTGYATADYELWSESSHLVLLFLMFVGGCAGSTGGGLKVIRFILLLKFAKSEIYRLLHPKAIIPVRFNGEPIERSVMTNISGFFVVYSIIAGLAVIVVSMFGLDIHSSIGAVVATLNNVGPGIGTVGPTENYSSMPNIVKWVLSLLMLLGRLEVFTILVLLTPTFWRK